MPRSEAVKRWVKKHNLTAIQIARALGVSHIAVRLWLIGKRTPTGLYRKALMKKWPDWPGA